MNTPVRPAPRTWFSRAPEGTRDPDQEAFLALGAAMVLLAAPVAIVAGGLGYLAGRAARLRWWTPLAAAAAAALVVALVYGPAEAATRYSGGYRHLWGQAGGLTGLPSALRAGWAGFVGALAPLSVPLALAGTGLGLGYAELRRPAWRHHQPAPGRVARRASTVRRRLEAASPVVDERLALGVDLESGTAVELTPADLSAHAFAAGASRSGKTTALLRLCEAAVAWGWPLVVVDLKGDPDVTRRLRELAGAAGVPFWGWTLDGGATWNPLAHGDPSQLKDKLIGLEEWTEPHYQRAAERFLQLVFTALAARPEAAAPTLAEVVGLLDPKKLAGLARRLPEGAGDALFAYADGLTADQRSAVAGLATRLALLTESTAGPYLAAAPGAVDLAKLACGTGGGVVLFSLDSGRWPELSAQVGALVVQDLKAVCGQALQGDRRRWAVVIDEFSALDATQLLGLLARGAAAGCSVTLATQELADLDVAAPGFRDQVLGNTALKIAFRQDVPASAELWAGMAGTEAGWVETIQTAHRSATPLSPATGQATGTGSLRSVEQFVVHPNTIKRLPQGRCLLIRKHPAFSARVIDVVIPRSVPTQGKAPAA